MSFFAPLFAARARHLAVLAIVLGQLPACGGGGGGSSSPAAVSTPTSASPAASTKAAPAVTQNPESMVVQVGQPATFAVQATGSDTLSFQWMRGGNPIVGATTNTYAMPVTQLADNGASFSVAAVDAFNEYAPPPING